MRAAGASPFASLTLAYNQEDYIERCLRELAPHVGRCIVMYSDRPFTLYNPGARREYTRVDGTREILRRLESEIPHLHVIEGVWDDEQAMREAGHAAALAAGFEYLLIVDADEFYRRGDLASVTKLVADLPGDCFTVRMCVPYKFADRVADRDDHFLPVAVRVHEGVRFVDRRYPNATREKRTKLPPEIVCFNMGFVMSDERMLEKTRTYSHAHQLPPRWYEEKWLAFSDETRDLHTREPALWPRARPFDPDDLPEALRGHPLLRPYGRNAPFR